MEFDQERRGRGPDRTQARSPAPPSRAAARMSELQRSAGNRAVGSLVQRALTGDVVQRQVLTPLTSTAPPTLEPPAIPWEGPLPEVFQLPPINAAERVAVQTATRQAERAVAERAAEEVVVQVGERIVSKRLLAGLTAVAVADEWNPIGWVLDGVIIALLVYDVVEGYRTVRTSVQTRPAHSPPSAEAPGATSGVRIIDPVPVPTAIAPQSGPVTPAIAPGTSSGAAVSEPVTDNPPLQAARRADPELDRLMDVAVTLQLEVGAVSGGAVTAVSRGGPRTRSSRDPMSSPMIRSIEELMRRARLIDPDDGKQPYHAEKKMVVQWGGPFAVDQDICHNCWRFLRWFAGDMGRRIVVADPRGVYVITPNGGVLTGPLVVRVPASR